MCSDAANVAYCWQYLSLTYMLAKCHSEASIASSTTAAPWHTADSHELHGY